MLDRGTLGATPRTYCVLHPFGTSVPTREEGPGTAFARLLPSQSLRSPWPPVAAVRSALPCSPLDVPSHAYGKLKRPKPTYVHAASLIPIQCVPCPSHYRCLRCPIRPWPEHSATITPALAYVCVCHHASVLMSRFALLREFRTVRGMRPATRSH
ncbi:hypothetical protein BV20DRAFT_253923 [Pilatotrama ljubarskyi]|nr:hypothetical protein BV20DRAFT_253923 [Pilatotrama ljubarskyi]